MNGQQRDPVGQLSTLLARVQATGATVTRVETSPHQYKVLTRNLDQYGKLGALVRDDRLPPGEVKIAGVLVIPTNKPLSTTYAFYVKRATGRVELWA